MDTKELLKMGAEFNAAKEKLKTELVARGAGIIAELKAIGFDYELVEAGGGKKIGRPKKERANGLAAS